jgi:predicted nucleic acid-binding protein
MLLLDSEAISVVSHGPDARRDKVRTMIAQMRLRELPVATVAAVLAEVVRGRRADAGVFAAIRRERIQVLPVDTRVGVRAGQLLGRARAGSEMAIDAFLVAAADLGGAIVATTDPGDLRRLALTGTGVSIVDVS